MSDRNYEQIIYSGTGSLASSTASGQTLGLSWWTVPASKRGQTSYLRIAANNSSGKVDIYHGVAGATTENTTSTGGMRLVWRSTDGLAATPSSGEKAIDLLERYMNGLQLEASDILRAVLTMTASHTAAITLSASAWVVERDQ